MNLALRVLLAALACASGAVAAAAGPSPGSDDPPAEQRIIPYGGELPSCGDRGVLAEISWRFADREQTYWNSSLALVDFVETSEIGYRSNGESYIPRRYCRGKAYFNDGQRREVGYEIGEGTDVMGLGWGVTWCVVGLDRNHAFSPNCRAPGP